MKCKKKLLFVVGILCCLMIFVFGFAACERNEGNADSVNPGDTTQNPSNPQQPDDTQNPDDSQKPDDTQKPGLNIIEGVVFDSIITTYDGTEKSIAVTNIPDVATVTYDKANTYTNAGIYIITATISQANYEDLQLTATLTINKATYDMSGVVFEDKTVIYDGETHFITATNLPNGVNVSYENNGKKDVDRYNITAIFTGDNNNYEAIENKTAILTINKATYDMSGVVFEDKTVTYDGNMHSIVAQNVPDGLAISYMGNSKINVGTYDVTAIFTDMSGNYENPDVLEAHLIITKAMLTGITFSDKILVYDTQMHSISIDGVVPDCVIVTYNNNEKVNVGTYLVTVSFEDMSGNYIVPKDMTAKLIIQKAIVEGVSFENKTFTYNGKKHSLAVDGILPQEVTVSYINNDKINANTYNVIATFTCETNNYVVPDDMTAILTIKKAVYDMSAVDFISKTVTYNGNSHALSVSGNLPDGVSVSYMNNDKIDANQYIVTAIFTGDNINYHTIDDMQAILTINKANYDMSGISFVGGRFIYDGTPKYIYIAGELPNGMSVNYINNGKINANTYTVTATFTGDTDNYNKISDWSASLIIDKATYDMSGVSFKNQTFIYDKSPKEVLISGNLPNGVEVSYIDNIKTNVGTYTVTAKFSGDINNYYPINDMQATLKINQAVPHIKEVACSNTLNLHSTVKLVADTDVEGTVEIDNGQMLVLGYKSYAWTFIPVDRHNYTNATGTIGLTVCALVSYYNEDILYDSQNIVLNNSAYIPSGMPIKEDSNGYSYTFSHWSIEENGMEYDFTNSITEDLNLFAVYDSEEIVYNIYFYATKNAENENITTFTVSTEYVLMPLEIEHYMFNGWTDANGNVITAISKGTFGALNLYADWTPIEYTITYNLGYRGVTNTNLVVYNIEDAFSFEDAVYDEYHTFAGWYSDENFIDRKSSIAKGEFGDIKLYAKWNFSGTFISTVDELQSIAYNLDGVYELKNSISLDATYTALGEISDNPFTGYFNGADYSLDGKTPFAYNRGILKNIKSDRTICNYNYGNILYCSGKGITPYNEGEIKFCYSNGCVSSGTKGNGQYYAGGLVAYNKGTIAFCYADADFSEATYSSASKYGSVTASGYFGGLVGYSETTIRFSYVNCAFTVTGDAGCYYDSYYHTYTGSTCSIFVGGICAYGSVSDCYTTGNFTAECKRSQSQSLAYASAFLIAPNATNCFSNCSAKCSSMSKTENIGPDTSALNATSKNYIKNILGWDEANWILQDGEYPKLHFEIE